MVKKKVNPHWPGFAQQHEKAGRPESDAAYLTRRGGHYRLRTASPGELGGWPIGELAEAARQAATLGRCIGILAMKRTNGPPQRRLALVPPEVLDRAGHLSELEL